MQTGVAISVKHAGMISTTSVARDLVLLVYYFLLSQDNFCFSQIKM